MTGEQIWLVIAGGAGLVVLLWGWRRFDIAAGSPTYGSAEPEEPCWTEELASDGRHRYGRSGCYHEQLAEMDARGRRGEFDTHV
ncbi:MAG TPA: hypothetical protein VGW34_14170 [Allosphingosinicella sp.]|nr:hypothetical protein [Allosphingosinicella sp.]